MRHGNLATINVMAGNHRRTNNPDKLANHALTATRAVMAAKFVSTVVFFGQASMQAPSNSFSLVAGALFGCVTIALCAEGATSKV
mgnify:CR=1 FL=1